MTITGSHGFVWPNGLPSCAACARTPNDPMHVTPSRAVSTLMSLNRVSASEPGKHNPVRPHAYTTKGATTARIPCALCGQQLAHSGHLVGAPAGVQAGKRTSVAIPEPPSLAQEEPVVIEGGDKLVLATRAAGVVDIGADVDAHFRRELAAIGDSPHLWVSGRYVGADSPNRNGAYWSTADLQMGQPTVANGPVNWLHEGRHVIGAIAGSALVPASQTAGTDELGTHIVALGAVWPWLYPDESKMIQQASDAGSLWFSMECIAREVACLAEGCGNLPSYRSYMLERETARCEHMAAGAPRRFVDPIFQGVGIIVPPVRPGWAQADARVTEAQTEQVVLREAAAFTGMSDGDAAGVAYQLLNSATTWTAP